MPNTTSHEEIIETFEEAPRSVVLSRVPVHVRGMPTVLWVYRVREFDHDEQVRVAMALEFADALVKFNHWIDSIIHGGGEDG